MEVKNLANKEVSKNDLIKLVDTEYYIIFELIKNVYGGCHALYFIRDSKTHEILDSSDFYNDILRIADNEMKIDKLCVIWDYKELY